MRKIRNFIWDIRCGIGNLIAYFPVIWKDRQFSDEYLYGILYKKLEMMEREFKSEPKIYIGQEKDAKHIMVAKNLAKRLYNNSHLENATIWHDRKYGDYIFVTGQWLTIDVDGQKMYRYVDDTDKERDADFSRCCKRSEYSEKRDREYLCDMIKRYSPRWWI